MARWPLGPSPSTLRDRDPALTGGSGVLGLGTDEPIVAVLLHDVGAPAGHSADGEDRRSEIRGDPEEGVGRRRVVVHIYDVDLRRRGSRHLGALPFDLGGETFLDLEVLRTPPILRELLREPPQEFRTRVLGLVNTVAEPRELVLRRD